MPSNVRRFDGSCKTSKELRFYYCVTCDPAKILLICNKCLQNGSHKNHQVGLIFQFSNKTHCNCGDQSGLIYCKNHPRSNLENDDRPLYSNNLQMNVFIKLFELNLKDTTQLSSQCQIRRVKPESFDWNFVRHYFENSKLSSKVDIKIRTMWSVFNKAREQIFVDKGFDKVRRMLLWHGTKTKNIASILERGFVLPVPGTGSTVVNGSMFGLGVYFSDRVSKSAQYCDYDGEGIVFLCEVSLGSMWREGKATNYKNVPPNFHSIKGVGKFKPDPKGDVNFDEDIIAPAGITIPNTHPDIAYSHLNYNEYIVFDPDRILIKFIIQVGIK